MVFKWIIGSGADVLELSELQLSFFLSVIQLFIAECFCKVSSDLSKL